MVLCAVCLLVVLYFASTFCCKDDLQYFNIFENCTPKEKSMNKFKVVAFYCTAIVLVLLFLIGWVL